VPAHGELHLEITHAENWRHVVLPMETKEAETVDLKRSCQGRVTLTMRPCDYPGDGAPVRRGGAGGFCDAHAGGMSSWHSCMLSPGG